MGSFASVAGALTEPTLCISVGIVQRRISEDLSRQKVEEAAGRPHLEPPATNLFRNRCEGPRVPCRRIGQHADPDKRRQCIAQCHKRNCHAQRTGICPRGVRYLCSAVARSIEPTQVAHNQLNSPCKTSAQGYADCSCNQAVHDKRCAGLLDNDSRSGLMILQASFIKGLWVCSRFLLDPILKQWLLQADLRTSSQPAQNSVRDFLFRDLESHVALKRTIQQGPPGAPA
jgi:hypothetical protein